MMASLLQEVGVRALLDAKSILEKNTPSELCLIVTTWVINHFALFYCPLTHPEQVIWLGKAAK